MPTMPVGSPDPVSGPWVPGASLASDPRLADETMPPEVTLDMCAEAATDLLYSWTGRRFRVLTRTVRPNAGMACGCSIDECSTNTELLLPVGPVDPDSIVVTIGGAVLAASAYTLYDGRRLVRTDGGVWPTCQHLSTPNGQEGSFSIAFNYGELPPMSLVLACRELAIHVALRLCNKPSKIPARATTASRRGVSINLMRGRDSTGIDIVDDAVRAHNPNRLHRRGSVSSPDRLRSSSL